MGRYGAIRRMFARAVGLETGFSVIILIYSERRCIASSTVAVINR